MEVGDDLNRSIWKRLKNIPLKERIADSLDGLMIELIGEMSTDSIRVGRLVGCLADVIDRGPAGTGASEDLVQLIGGDLHVLTGGDLHVLTGVNRKFISEAVENKMKQVLFL